MATADIQDRRRMFDLFGAMKVNQCMVPHGPSLTMILYLPQDHSIKVDDTVIVSLLDEAIKLWNSMWMADHIHDQTISENVKGMQETCSTLLEELRNGIEQLMQKSERPQVRKLAAARRPTDR
jgi:hypothetical protein